MSRGKLLRWATAPLAVIALAAIIPLCVLPSKGGSAATTSQPVGTVVNPCVVQADLDVVIIIDRSGSMVSNSSGGQTRLYWAKQAALALVNGIAGGPSNASLGSSHVEVITFGGGSASVVQSFSGNADTVRSAINGISDPSSGTTTAIAPALIRATTDLNAHVHGGTHGSFKTVVLLSDGRNWGDDGPSCTLTHQRRTDTLNAIPNLHAATDTIYTVGIGDQTSCGSHHDELCDADYALSCNSDELDVDILTQIAEGPPGDYTNVEDASNLSHVYFELSQEIVNICVNFSGHKYDDLECDGPEPVGAAVTPDPPLSGITIRLLDAQGNPVSGVSPATTDANGVYSFENVLPGSYVVCEDLSTFPFPGRTQSYPTLGSGTGAHPPYGVCYERTIASGGNASGLDFYNCPASVPTATPTATSAPTDTPTPICTNTPTPTSTNPPVNTNTPTPTSTNPPVNTDTPTPTSTNPPVNTDTPTPTSTNPPVNTNTPAPTSTDTPEATNTPRHHHSDETDTPTPRSPTATFTPVSQVSPAAVTPTAGSTPVHEVEALPQSGSGDGSGPSGGAAAGMVVLALAGIVLLEGRRLVRNRK